MTNVMNLLILTFLVSCGNANLFDGKLTPERTLEETAQEQDFLDDESEYTEYTECIDGFYLSADMKKCI